MSSYQIGREIENLVRRVESLEGRNANIDEEMEYNASGFHENSIFPIRMRFIDRNGNVVQTISAGRPFRIQLAVNRTPSRSIQFTFEKQHFITEGVGYVPSLSPVYPGFWLDDSGIQPFNYRPFANQWFTVRGELRVSTTPTDQLGNATPLPDQLVITAFVETGAMPQYGYIARIITIMPA